MHKLAARVAPAGSSFLQPTAGSLQRRHLGMQPSTSGRGELRVGAKAAGVVAASPQQVNLGLSTRLLALACTTQRDYVSIATCMSGFDLGREAGYNIVRGRRCCDHFSKKPQERLSGILFCKIGPCTSALQKLHVLWVPCSTENMLHTTRARQECSPERP